MLTDSHCHVTMSTDGRAALDRARAAGVRGFVVPATSLDDAEAAIEVAESNADAWAAVGFHPHEASRFDDAAEARIRELASHERVVGIGEIGLDYYYDHSPRETQRDALVRQLGIARDLDLPVIIHNRESTGDLLDLLRSENARDARGILHSFTESLEVARELLDLGYLISFSGIVTFRSAEMLREVAKALPRDRVLIETDTPYLAPVPKRGRENEPAFVVHVAEELGRLWGEPVERVGALTSAGFERVFGVRIAG